MKLDTKLLTGISNLDPYYNVFNGSKLYSNGILVFVWRAQKKPDITCKGIKYPPTFPYITVTGKWDFDEYLGIYVKDSTFQKYKHKGVFPAEDPRLYTKHTNGDIYMEYTAVSECTRDRVCIGLWELNLSKYLIDSVNVEPVMICAEIVDHNVNSERKSIFNYYEHHMYKNFSYVPFTNTYIDGYNEDLIEFKGVTDTDITACKVTNINIPGTDNNLKHFIHDDWKIALTSPTLKNNKYLYGVAHVRVSWENLSRNYDICLLYTSPSPRD